MYLMIKWKYEACQRKQNIEQQNDKRVLKQGDKCHQSLLFWSLDWGTARGEKAEWFKVFIVREEIVLSPGLIPRDMVVLKSDQ